MQSQQHIPALIRLPGLIQMVSYGAPIVTGEFVEQLAAFLATETGEELTHTFRSTFPRPLDRTRAAEAERAWKSQKGTLRLSNKLSSPNHIEFVARPAHRPTESGRALYGFVAVYAKSGAPVCSALARAFAAFCAKCQSSFARVDSPTWGQETTSKLAFPTMVAAVAPGWVLRERPSWSFYLSEHALHNLPAGAFSRFAGNGGIVHNAWNGGAIMQVSEHLLRDSSPSDIELLSATAELFSLREGVF